jgi:hypothetical protein
MPLGKNGDNSALIDPEDFKRVSEHTWSLHKLGYVYRQIRVNGKKKTLYLHREILGLKEGDGLVVDHIDGDRTNNSRSNLRVGKGNSLNCQNVRSRPGSSSEYRGVTKRGDKWEASLKVDGKAHYLGLYEDEMEAARAAQAKRSEVMEWNVLDPRLDTPQDQSPPVCSKREHPEPNPRTGRRPRRGSFAPRRSLQRR